MKTLAVLILLCIAACPLAALVKGPVNKPLEIIEVENIDDQSVKLIAYMEYSIGNSWTIKELESNVSIPEELGSSGYKLYKREFISREGSFWMLEENMEALGYSNTLVMTLPESLGGKPVKIMLALYASRNPDLPQKLPPPTITAPENFGSVKFYSPDYYPVFSFDGEGTAFRAIMNGYNGDEVSHRILYNPGTRNFNYNTTVDGVTYEVTVQQCDDSLRWSEPAVVTFRVDWGFYICTWCNGEGEVRCNRCHGTGQIYQYGNPSGYEKCPECNGTGRIECRWCWGRGWNYK